MSRAIEVGEDVGGAHRSVASRVVQNTRDHRTLWVGVLYAIVIIMVLAVVAKLN
jgi:t-SNARE complex subunit (syntaxin)